MSLNETIDLHNVKERLAPRGKTLAVIEFAFRLVSGLNSH
jgi:hypothetical protein